MSRDVLRLIDQGIRNRETKKKETARREAEIDSIIVARLVRGEGKRTVKVA